MKGQPSLKKEGYQFNKATYSKIQWFSPSVKG
jgi:hypothetical protein